MASLRSSVPSALVVSAVWLGLLHQCHAAGQRRPAILQDEEAESKNDVVALDASHVYGPVLQLNDNIFNGNVLRQDTDRVGHWMVYWCPEWWEPCQKMKLTYTRLAIEWQEKLNAGSFFSQQVRFASVDCATDKPLCNVMGVQDYPTVQHFHAGQHVSTLAGSNDAKHLAAWFKHELSGVSPASSGPSTIAEVTTHVRVKLSEYLEPGERTLDVFVIVALLAITLWVVTHNTNLGYKASVAQQSRSVPMPSPLSPLQPTGMADEEVASELPEKKSTGVERLLPDEWLRQRTSMDL